MNHPATQAEEKLDIREVGAPKDGQPQTTDRRLFFQLHVYTQCFQLQERIHSFQNSGLTGVIYEDVNDPRGVGMLTVSEDPEIFVTKARDVFLSEPFRSLVPRPELTMMGRTYSMGREADLEDWLLRKPLRNALENKWPWAVWYPLRRKPEFALLDKAEQGKILGEHAMIGMNYGKSDFAHDIRLACHGLDQNDNEFVIGLVGPDLYPLSRIVQDMRKTQQTSKYIQSLGPFFVGRAAWQSPKPL